MYYLKLLFANDYESNISIIFYYKNVYIQSIIIEFINTSRKKINRY